ncbi:aminoglycoside phosphotransferase family protein [Actinomadura violacea]|uniref:Aminoglycoside phosphotransferase family protein n=1 Tax=Actinomadura violacea TaxID=2819934 RepID=A0ABS3RYW3_9ACTN|nr:aminoglycoside phosphotransferase family protein [Actinomadura violacea]MBO2461483.1 aminoglycoside phosphotransferase family protein [Actinomadura violacea]
MTSTGTAVRPSWEQLPARLRDGLADRLGRVEGVQVQTGGFTPGLAARLQLADGDRVFVKGIDAGHPLAGRYTDEARVTRALPAAVPAPKLRWDARIAGWLVLAFDDAGGRHADLAPGSPDVAAVVETVAGLAAALTPCPVPDVPDAGIELADFVHGWRELAAGPDLPADAWVRRNLDLLADAETAWLQAADGATLLHGDINRSNLLITEAGEAGGVVLVDWGQPVRGAAWIDVADLIPHLILAGHTPAAAEDAVAGALAAALREAGAGPEMVTGYAAGFAGYWARTSRLLDPPGVPHLRGHQARAARAAAAWVAHRTGWA